MACSVTVSRPVGGILYDLAVAVAIHLSGLPGGAPGGADGPPILLLDLAPDGGCQPPGSPRTLVRSYRTVAPLPVTSANRGPSAVCSLLPCPAGHPALTLVSVVPCGVPTFLDTVRVAPPVPRPPGRLTVAGMVPLGRPAGRGTGQYMYELGPRGWMATTWVPSCTWVAPTGSNEPGTW